MEEKLLDRAIATLSMSDPLIKLLNEVKLGRMRASDPGLRAITETWLETYRQVLKDAESLEPAALRRLDPRPRLEILVAAGVVAADHPEVSALHRQFQQAISRAAP